MKKAILNPILVCLALLAVQTARAEEVPPWVDYWSKETIRCDAIKMTYFYTFSSDPEKVKTVGDLEVSEGYCETSRVFHGDINFKIKAFATEPVMTNVGQCWKEIARTQLDGAKCCFENATGSMVRPWLVCGVKGSRAKETRAKKVYISQILKNLHGQE